MSPSNEDPATILASVKQAQARGYNQVFRIDAGHFMSADGQKTYSPDNINVDGFYPVSLSDNRRATVYLIETIDHQKGIIVDTFEMESSERFSHFLHPGN